MEIDKITAEEKGDYFSIHVCTCGTGGVPPDPPVGSARDLILYGDSALRTKPVMHYQDTAYLCY